MTGPGDIGGLGLKPREGILDALKAGRIKGEDARLRAATDALEGSFYQELFKAMRDSVPESGLMDGGGGEDSFTALLDEHLSEVAAAQSEGGIGQALYRFFTRGEGS
jgi:Rod binding domain-containing protein